MTAATSVASQRDRDTVTNAGLWFLQAFVLFLLLIPAVVVLPGPLKSNGSPAIVFTLVAAGLVAAAFVRGKIGAGLGWGPLALLVAGGLNLITWATGFIKLLDPPARAGTLRGLISIVGYTSIALLTMLALRTFERRLALVRAIVIGLSYCGVIGILQSTTSYDGRYLLRPPGFILNREFAFRLRSGFTRAFGTSDSPIEFAVLMASLVAVSFFLLRAGTTTATRALALVGIAIGLVGIPSSVSRTAVVCLAAVLLISLVSSPIRSIVSGAFAFGLLFFAYIVAVPSQAGELLRLFTGAASDNSVTARTDDYSYVFNQFSRSPIFGSGLGSSLPTETRYLDNQWLQAIVQGGVVGVLALLVIFGSALAGVVGGLRKHRRGLRHAEVVAYAAVVAAIFSASFTFDLFAFAQVKFVLFITFGLIFSALADYGAVSTDQRRDRMGVAG